MSNVPANLKYAASHELMLLNADGSVTIGISDHAQEALGDLVFIELPEVGAHYDAEKEIAIVESVKAAADVYAPIAGTVTEVNQAAADAPESVNQDAYAAWLFKLTPDNVTDLDQMLDAAAYQAVADAA
jgi:glycine cleavage system H protein